APPRCQLRIGRWQRASGPAEPSRSTPAPDTPTVTWWRPGASTTLPSVVSQFLVPAGTRGLAVQRTWDSLGIRASRSDDLHLPVTVPRDALLGGVEGLALAVARMMPQWMVASYAAVY